LVRAGVPRTRISTKRSSRAGAVPRGPSIAPRKNEPKPAAAPPNKRTQSSSGMTASGSRNPPRRTPWRGCPYGRLQSPAEKTNLNPAASHTRTNEPKTLPGACVWIHDSTGYSKHIPDRQDLQDKTIWISRIRRAIPPAQTKPRITAPARDGLAALAQSVLNRFRMPRDRRQQHPRRTVRARASLLPILERRRGRKRWATFPNGVVTQDTG
jgi:hypothetical protein